MITKTYNFERRLGRGPVVLSAEYQEAIEVPLSPFVYFSPSDRICVTYDHGGSIATIDKLLAVPGRAGMTDSVKVYPYYAHHVNLALMNGTTLPVVYKEVTTDEEFEQLRYLEQFHYLQAKPAWGRQMYIVIRPESDEILGTPLPFVLGCVVLTSPSILSGPRNNLLSWNDREVLKENVDRVVRIARVIVHPEFRGLGLGSTLVHHSIEYCRERWNVQGKKAWFVETVAEMSRYHPFFEKGGMKYVGETKSHEKAFFWDNNSKSLGIDQGAGHVMASLKRFKQKVHSQKPYLMVSLLPESDPYTQRILNAQLHPLVSDHVTLVETRLDEPISFREVTAVYKGKSVWNEPEELNEKWLNDARKSHADLVAYLEKLQSVVNGLRGANLWTGSRTDLFEARLLVDNLEQQLNDSRDTLANLQDRISGLFGHLDTSLKGLVAGREQLLRQLASLRDRIEEEIRIINRLEDEAKDASKSLPTDESKKRSELNTLRLHVQGLESELEIGTSTAQQRWVTEAFGVKPGQSTRTLNNFNFEIWPGSIVLVVGPSGSGKSTLLSLVSGTLQPHSGTIGPMDLADHVSVLDLDFDPSKPLIDLVGTTAEESVFLLNHVDLAESHLYLKRRDQLSHGQRYRAAFAQMLADRRSVWLADEFCAFLDPVTTLTLCKGIRKLVRRQGITFIAAAAKEDYIREALEPDVVLRINAGGHLSPAPVPMHWSIQPDPTLVLQALSGQPHTVDRELARWMKQISLLETDPFTLSGVRWTRAAGSLQLAGRSSIPTFGSALAEHLWSRDWLFHRLWNRVTKSQTPVDISCIQREEHVKPHQLRYRKDLIDKLICHWTVDPNCFDQGAGC